MAKKGVSPTEHGSRAHPVGTLGGGSYGRGTGTGLAFKGCLVCVLVGPNSGGAGSVRGLLGKLALKMHGSQNP